MPDQPTVDTITPDQLADLIADAEAFRNQPALRHCLVPGCLREFDAATHMAGKPPTRPSWSGTGWHQLGNGTIYPAGGHICPDHADLVTAHLPRHVDLPNGRWTVDCACGWTPTPQTWRGLLRALWEQHLLTATGALTVPVTLAEKPVRMPLEEHTEATLTELYDRLEDTEYDRQETYEAAQAMYKAWDWHRHTLGGVSRAVVAVCNMMRTSADFLDQRDWTANRIDAYLWSVLIGFDDDTLQGVAARHGWNEHRIKYVREMRALLAPITDPQPED